jgi:hypothetical protein
MSSVYLFFADQEVARFQFFKQVISLLQAEKRAQAGAASDKAELLPYHLRLAEITIDGGPEQLGELFAQVMAPLWILNAQQLFISSELSESNESKIWWDLLEQFLAQTPTQQCHFLILTGSDPQHLALKSHLECERDRWSKRYPHLQLTLEWLELPIGLKSARAALQKFL